MPGDGAVADFRAQLALICPALEGMNEAAFLIDQHSRIRYVNAVGCHMLGYPRRELEARSIGEVDSDLPEGAWRARCERLRVARSVTFESRYRAKNGRIFPVEVRANHFDIGGHGHCLALVRDLTEARRSERERAAHLHFSVCMNQVNQAIQAAGDLDQMMRDVLDLMLSVFDGDRAFLVYPCDPETASWTVPMERTRPEYPGAAAQNVVIPLDADVARSFRTLLASDRPMTFGPGNDHPMVEAIGEQFGIRSFMSQAIYPKVGQPWQFGIHQCRRDRIWTGDEQRLFQEIGRRLEDGLSSLLTLRDLRASEQQYRRIISTANEGIWAIDADDRTTFVNPRLCRLLGYRSAEMLGRPVSDFTFDEDLPNLKDHLQSFRQGRLQQYERRYRHHDGRSVWAIVSATPDTDDAGYRGAFAMITDITEKKAAEEKLRELNEQLERRVQDRTRQLRASHEELDQAYRNLQTAHAQILQKEKLASIGQLAAGVAHEINTPAQYVTSNLVFLRDAFGQLLEVIHGYQEQSTVSRDGSVLPVVPDVPGLEDLDFLIEEIPRAIEESATGTYRIANIVGALKDFAHPSGGRQAPVDLAGLIRSTIEMTRNEWKLIAEVETDLGPDASQVMGLRDELGQVLLNLLVNAAHAIADAGAARGGPGRIRITAGRRGPWVEIRVQDTGSGIPPELQQRIFEPFFTTKAVGRGSGQGLAIAYDIVANHHHGQLLVESEAGTGTTFIVQLPASQDYGPDTPPRGGNAGGPTETVSSTPDGPDRDL